VEVLVTDHRRTAGLACDVPGENAQSRRGGRRIMRRRENAKEIGVIHVLEISPMTRPPMAIRGGRTIT
jgi:hypothetical protein